MKNLFSLKNKSLFIALLITSFFASSCQKEEEPLKLTEDGTYSGQLAVDQLNGTNYTSSNVQVKVTPSTSAGYITIDMLQVSFSPKMPVKLDMKIQNVAYTSTSEKITISGNNIVPIAMGGEFPAYTITNLTGEIQNGVLSLSMMCGSYPLTYNGTLLL
ncbi:hypothetical protein BRDCF_p1579 [Bacteroidales bacterium CF]|jgi:hypothetical protein|nr:hypothetical protein BRDCF_p1579 [Bacteroidales bacterium CF]